MSVRPFSPRLLAAYWNSLTAATGRVLWVALGLSVVSGITEGIGVMLLIPLLQLVGIDAGQGSVRAFTSVVASALGKVGLMPSIGTVLVIYALVNVAQSAIQRMQTQREAMVEHQFAHSLRCGLYSALLGARWAFLARVRTARFSHALGSEVDRIGVSTHHAILLASQSILALIYVGFAFRISVTMTAVALFSGGLLSLLLSRGLKAARETGEALTRSGGDIHSAVLEHLGTLKKTKTAVAETQNYAAFRSYSARLMEITVKTITGYAALTAASRIGSVIILSVVLYLAVRVIHLGGAEILVLILIFSRLVPRFSAIQQSLQVFLTGLPAYERVMDLTHSASREAESLPPSSHAVRVGSGIRLERVSFRYDASGPEIIRNLSLTIPAARTTALVGPSGAGKTTVADMLMGLLQPDSGHLIVDGRPLTHRDAGAWRAAVGYVGQEAVLFHDSIRANLLWAAPEAAEPDLWRALERAAAADFVARLPEGLDTQAGDRGTRLSGGERQRISLAQTLLRTPELLVLDEATSAVDAETEQRIRSAIEALHGQITIVIITHRLSTVRNADMIHVLERGELVDSGTWNSLTRRHDSRLSLLAAENA